MSDAKVCDRCGKTHSPSLWKGKNWTLRYKSIHKPSTFIGARNRTFDLCNECRRKLDKFLGLERGEQPAALKDE